MAKPTALLDRNNLPMQALAPIATVAATVGAVSSRYALPADTWVVRLAAVNDCYLAFGDSNVNASGLDILFLRGVEVVKVPPGATHFAVVQHTTGGAFSLTVLE